MSATLVEESVTSLPDYEPAEALARLEGDVDLLAAIFDVFRTERPRMLEAIRRAVENGDLALLKHAAHEFKGSVGNFADPETADAALALELMARRGTMSGARHELERLEAAVGRFESALGSYLAQQTDRA